MSQNVCLFSSVCLYPALAYLRVACFVVVVVAAVVLARLYSYLSLLVC